MENFNTKDILAVLIKNKRGLILVVVVAAVISTAVSFLLKPKFKSISVTYPVNIYIGPEANSRQSSTEILLQYFQSEQVKNRVAAKFKLMEHYGVDTTSSGYNALFDYYWRANVGISPTLYESVEIEVKDEFPATAQAINNAIIDETNALFSSVKKQRLKEYIDAKQKTIDSKNHRIDSLTAKITEIKNKYNLYSARYQAKNIAKALDKGQTLSAEDKLTLEGLKNQTQQIDEIETRIKGEFRTLNFLIKEQAKFLADFGGDIKFIDVVSPPTLPDKKCFPVRWVIVTLSTLSAFALAALFFIFSHKSVRKVD